MKGFLPPEPTPLMKQVEEVEYQIYMPEMPEGQRHKWVKEHEIQGRVVKGRRPVTDMPGRPVTPGMIG